MLRIYLTLTYFFGIIVLKIRIIKITWILIGKQEYILIKKGK